MFCCAGFRLKVHDNWLPSPILSILCRIATCSWFQDGCSMRYSLHTQEKKSRLLPRSASNAACHTQKLVLFLCRALVKRNPKKKIFKALSQSHTGNILTSHELLVFHTHIICVGQCSELHAGFRTENGLSASSSRCAEFG